MGVTRSAHKIFFKETDCQAVNWKIGEVLQKLDVRMGGEWIWFRIICDGGLGICGGVPLGSAVRGLVS